MQTYTYSSPNSSTNKAICWLFCTVIDNFGDIGVSWRLAQELHKRLGWHVYLFLDNIIALHTIMPQAPKQLPAEFRGIHLRQWHEAQYADFQAALSPNIIIEMFACTLPNSVRDIIRHKKPVWLNWEYLSAEDWAIRSHQMPSLQHDGSQKYFWQMGFVPASGGLLREINYPIAIPKSETATQKQPEIHIFAFGYPSDIWTKWCATLAAQKRPIVLHTAGGHIINSLKRVQFVPHDALMKHGDSHTQSSLKIISQDFVPQDQFDALLQQYDINIIRGEDSFVRAQYAAKPLFWHIYPQAEHAHLDKLDAFWHTYWQHIGTSPFQAAFTALSNELNGAHVLNDKQRTEYWATLLDQQHEWQQAAQRWQQFLFEQPDTVSQLQNWLAAP